jgi:hypothetical protein
MSQRSIVLEFTRKELSAVVIHRNLVATLSPEAVSYSSVTRDLLRRHLFCPTLLPIFRRQNLSSSIATNLFSLHSPNSRLRQSRINGTDSPTTNHGAQALDPIVKVSGVPSSMDSPSFVTLSKTGSRDILITAIVCVGAIRMTMFP